MQLELHRNKIKYINELFLPLRAQAYAKTVTVTIGHCVLEKMVSTKIKNKIVDH